MRLPLQTCLVASAMTAAAVISLACGGSTSAPTAPSSNSITAAAGGPTAVLKIKTGTTPALMVLGGAAVFDASESIGTGLSYRIDFGDGEQSTEKTIGHQAKAAGAKTAKLTVADSQGRANTVEVPYVVAGFSDAAAVWTTTASGRDVSLKLLQQGTQIAGWYFEAGFAESRFFSGTISGERHVSAQTTDATIALDGDLIWASSTCTSDSCVTLRLTPRGGVADGRPIDFTSLVAAEPTARLDVSSGLRNASGIPWGIVSYTPITFDASASTGSGLTYELSYGDGERTSQAVTSHVERRSAGFGPLPVHLTVTDRFGRSSQANALVDVRGIDTGVSYYQGSGTELRFVTNAGQISAQFHDPSSAPGHVQSASGTFTGTRGFAIRTDDGTVTMDGLVESVGPFESTLRVTFHGGRLNGQTVTYQYRDVG